MDRRDFLAGAGGSLAATLAGCFKGLSGGESPQTGDAESTTRFLEEDETPESAGARKFLAAVDEQTNGVYRTREDGETERIGRFSEAGDVWIVHYYGQPTARGLFLEEIEALAIAFVSHRPDGVSLDARSLHECTTGTWGVRAETAAAYEDGEIDRIEFVDRVQERAEIVNNC